MENKSVAVRVVSELVERAENQENTIESQRKNIVKLNKQLKDKYSTDSYFLIERNKLSDMQMAFDELCDGFRQLENTLDDINSLSNDISNESEYNDARSFGETAREWIHKIEDILDPMPEEQETKEKVYEEDSTKKTGC